MTEQAVVILPWQRLSLIVGKLVFTFMIASQLAVFTWMIVSPKVLVLAEPTRAKGQGNVAQDQSIADWHIFGDAAVEVVAVGTLQQAVQGALLQVFYQP